MLSINVLHNIHQFCDLMQEYGRPAKLGRGRATEGLHFVQLLESPNSLPTRVRFSLIGQVRTSISNTTDIFSITSITKKLYFSSHFRFRNINPHQQWHKFTSCKTALYLNKYHIGLTVFLVINPYSTRFFSRGIGSLSTRLELTIPRNTMGHPVLPEYPPSMLKISLVNTTILPRHREELKLFFINHTDHTVIIQWGQTIALLTYGPFSQIKPIIYLPSSRPIPRINCIGNYSLNSTPPVIPLQPSSSHLDNQPSSELPLNFPIQPHIPYGRPESTFALLPLLDTEQNWDTPLPPLNVSNLVIFPTKFTILQSYQIIQSNIFVNIFHSYNFQYIYRIICSKIISISHFPLLLSLFPFHLRTILIQTFFSLLLSFYRVLSNSRLPTSSQSPNFRCHPGICPAVPSSSVFSPKSPVRPPRLQDQIPPAVFLLIRFHSLPASILHHLH